MLGKLLCDRNVIMLLGLIVGLAWGGAAPWTEPLTLPGLALGLAGLVLVIFAASLWVWLNRYAAQHMSLLDFTELGDGDGFPVRRPEARLHWCRLEHACA